MQTDGCRQSDRQAGRGRYANRQGAGWWADRGPDIQRGRQADRQQACGQIGRQAGRVTCSWPHTHTDTQMPSLSWETPYYY